MFELLSALCAGVAAWLWIPPRTPAQRLANLRPSGRPATGSPLPRNSSASGSPDAQSRSVSVHGQVTSGSPPHGTSSLDGAQQIGSASSPWPYGASDGAPSTPGWLDGGETVSRPVSRRTLFTASGTGLVAGLLVGGWIGVASALAVAAVAGAVLHRKEDPPNQRDLEQVAADLPFAADLMAACLLAGQPVSAATDTAAEAIAGPLGQRLSWVSRQLRLGADPEPTWAFLAHEPATGALARAMSRAAQSGAPVADVLTRLSDDAREATRAASVASARSVGVKAVAPLGLCFLPAFVLLGIIPVIAGLATTIALP
jgi:Flp pilus assembly protein TadB